MTPRAAHPTTGAHFFLPSFTSPKTMPKKAAAHYLEYLDSPTPAAPLCPTPTRGTMVQEKSASLQGELSINTSEDMDLSDLYATSGGLDDSMHAPSRNETPTPTVSQPPLTPHPPLPSTQSTCSANQLSGTAAATPNTVPQTPTLAPPLLKDESLQLPQDEALPLPQSASQLNPDLINALSAIAEASVNMISVSSSSLGNESYFMPTPANDFPITYRGLPGEFLIGLSPETVTAWCEVPSTKFFIRIFDYDGSNARTRHATLIGLVRIAIREIAKFEGHADVDARIAPPSAPAIPMIHPLITFLVYDISQETAAAILHHRIWSSSEITFEAFPFDTDTIPSLTLCLMGFTSPDEKSVRNAVLGAWSMAAPMTRMIDILQRLDPIFEGPTRRYDAREAIAAMVLSIRAVLVDFKEAGGIPSPRFNIFTESPTTKLKAWSEIKKFLFTIACPSLLIGTGHPTRTFYCHICHSLTHPRGLCPFPSLPGWKGPKHAQERAPPMRGRGRGGSTWRGRRGTPA